MTAAATASTVILARKFFDFLAPVSFSSRINFPCISSIKRPASQPVSRSSTISPRTPICFRTRRAKRSTSSAISPRVRKQIGVPEKMVDERLTSWEAERLMEEIQGRFIRDEKMGSNKKRKNVQAKMTVDAVAAAVILKEYLDRQEQTAGETRANQGKK